MYKCKCGNDKEFVLEEQVPRSWNLEQINGELRAYKDETHYELAYEEIISCAECYELVDIDPSEIIF